MEGNFRIGAGICCRLLQSLLVLINLNILVYLMNVSYQKQHIEKIRINGYVAYVYNSFFIKYKKGYL